MKEEKLLTLPIGIQTFEKLRQGGYLYVDKTERLLNLSSDCPWCFLSRPRRFGKSLTLSTLDAMFSGKAELFKGLAAEEWVTKQADHPSPVLRLDMSGLQSYKTANELERSLVRRLEYFASFHDMPFSEDGTGGGMLFQIIQRLFKAEGPVVVLIDEYDKPMLDNIGDPESAEEMRQTLRSFYTVLKGYDEYLRFVMLTGISKFSKTGVFSAMNNLHDISMNRKYGDVVGYTQQELEDNFGGWIDSTAKAMSLGREELLRRIMDYYDGFCFDGRTKLYNPFSILNFFSEQEFKNYWYTSGSSSFIVTYMKQHGIQDPEEYSHIEVPEDFADAHEIESSTPESFLYQSGYLTIEKRENDTLTLDYPNYEVRKSIVRMYLDSVYHVKNYITLGTKLWQALSEGNIEEAVRLYNIALAGIPYADFADQGELFYRSLFLMLLRGASITANGEVPGNLGRSDVLIQFPKRVVVLEFKFAKNGTGMKRLCKEGQKQIAEKGYAKPYDAENREITTAVIVINGKRREATL
ncbi:MAG: AAA family ATPase [Synergistaceae bacterium]|nr:AAA family ATPase [Synergistaceae bacterium]